MFGGFFRILSFLLPVPFMILFYIKTNKLNFLKNNPFPVFFVLVFLQIIFDYLGYNLPLIIAYISLTLLGVSIFVKKSLTYPQALSISFCLTYFGSFFWELPTHIYTIIIRGGIDGAFPLHLLFIFPVIFVYEKVKTNKTKKEIFSIVFKITSCSVIILLFLVIFNFDIWYVPANSPTNQIIEEVLWITNRIIVIVGLFKIYEKLSLRKVKKVSEKHG